MSPAKTVRPYRPPIQPHRMKGERPHEALDTQLRLIEWWKTQSGSDFVDAMRPAWKAGRDQNIRPKGMVPSPRSDPTGRSLGVAGSPSGFWSYDAQGNPQWEDEPPSNIHLAESESMNRAETYYCGREMSAIVAAAGESMPDSPLEETDLPARSGFVYFRQGLPIKETPQEYEMGPGVQQVWDFTIRAIRWYAHTIPGRDWSIEPLVEGVSMAIYVDKPAEWSVQHILLPTSSSGPMMLFDWTGWAFHKPWWTVQSIEDEERAYGDGATISTISLIRRYLLAFFRLCWQRIAMVTGQRADRALFRRAQRIGLTAPDMGTIKVVLLRKPVQMHRYEDDDEEVDRPKREWTHRWIVSAHWRNQWYPSLGDHRVILIQAHVKGPADKPLVVSDKIFALLR